MRRGLPPSYRMVVRRSMLRRHAAHMAGLPSPRLALGSGVTYLILVGGAIAVSTSTTAVAALVVITQRQYRLIPGATAGSAHSVTTCLLPRAITPASSAMRDVAFVNIVAA